MPSCAGSMTKKFPTGRATDQAVTKCMNRQAPPKKIGVPFALLLVFSFVAGCGDVQLKGISDQRFVATKSQPARTQRDAWIGVAVQDLPPEARRSLGEGRTGALIVGIEKDDPADKAGMRSGDIILEINRVRKRSAAEVIAAISALAPNVSTVLTLDRDGRRLFLTVVPRQVATRMEILDAQRNLYALGYYTGPIDGKSGGSTQEAVRTFLAANGLSQDGRLTPLVRNMLYHRAGIRAVERGDLDEGVALFTKLIASSPSKPRTLAQAYYNRGVAHGNAGRLERASVDWKKAVEVDPKYEVARVALKGRADFYYKRGVDHDDAGRREEAIADWERALTLDPGHAMARRSLDKAEEVPGRQTAPSPAPPTGEPAGIERPAPQPPPPAEKPLDELLGLD